MVGVDIECMGWQRDFLRMVAHIPSIFNTGPQQSRWRGSIAGRLILR
jgi:hypothetical protein